MIKAIAFDYNGVIEIIEKDLRQKMSDYLKISPEDWLRSYYSFNYLCATGKKSYKEVYAMVAKEFNASDADVAHIHKMMDENMQTRKINFELLEIIKDLKNKGYKIGLVTNNHIKTRQKITDEKVIDYFDTAIISAEVDCFKPEPQIFHILFDKLGVEANEVVFIDDHKTSLFGAEKIGYTPILYINNEQLKEELRKLNIKI